MSWTLYFREEDGILQVTTAGVHTPEDVRRMALEALAEGQKLGISKYLVDDRKMTPDFRTLDIYRLPRDLPDLGASTETIVATVFSSRSSKREDFRFYELTSNNAGRPTIRVFEDSLEAALEWLRTSAPHRQPGA